MTMLGVLREVDAELMKLEEQDAQYQPFVKQARDLAKAYDDEGLAKFFKKFM